MATYDPFFDSERNRSLLAVAARQIIAGIGVGGIIWGLINTAIGVVTLPQHPINAGLILLGLTMLGTGILALARPRLRVLLAETIVAFSLFGWNLFITFWNYQETGETSGDGLIFPIIIAVSLLGTYRKLGHVKEQIASLDRQQVKTAKQLNRKLLRAKPALDPDLIPSVGNTCRIKIMGDEAFFVQRGAARPFVAERENVRDALVNAEAAKLCLRFEHPLGKLKYTFSKANSQKLRGWLDDVPPTAPPPEG